MKTSRWFVLLLALTCSVGALSAKPIPGPKGGRILTTAAPHAELFVEKDLRATVTFYDAQLKPVAPADQVVNAVVEMEDGRKFKFAFDKTAAGFVSQQPLPEGDDYTIVVQIRPAPGAGPKNYRVVYEDSPCDTCQRPQYACICEAK